MSFNDDGAAPEVGSRKPGGFAPDRQSTPRPAPAGADPELWEMFDRADADQLDEIDATELQTALLNGDRSLFDINTINLLINIFDNNRDGRIGFDEFSRMWKYIESWQVHFTIFDSDKSGTIDRAELQKALTGFGYTVTPQLLNILQHKYDVTASAPQADSANLENSPPPGITFDRFVRACVVLHQVTEAFKALDTDRDGWINIDYLQFLRTFLWFP